MATDLTEEGYFSHHHYDENGELIKRRKVVNKISPISYISDYRWMHGGIKRDEEGVFIHLPPVPKYAMDKYKTIFDNPRKNEMDIYDDQYFVETDDGGTVSTITSDANHNLYWNYNRNVEDGIGTISTTSYTITSTAHNSTSIMTSNTGNVYVTYDSNEDGDTLSINMTDYDNGDGSSFKCSLNQLIKRKNIWGTESERFDFLDATFSEIWDHYLINAPTIPWNTDARKRLEDKFVKPTPMSLTHPIPWVDVRISRFDGSDEIKDLILENWSHRDDIDRYHVRVFEDLMNSSSSHRGIKKIKSRLIDYRLYDMEPDEDIGEVRRSMIHDEFTNRIFSMKEEYKASDWILALNHRDDYRYILDGISAEDLIRKRNEKYGYHKMSPQVVADAIVDAIPWLYDTIRNLHGGGVTASRINEYLNGKWFQCVIPYFKEKLFNGEGIIDIKNDWEYNNPITIGESDISITNTSGDETYTVDSIIAIT